MSDDKKEDTCTTTESGSSLTTTTNVYSAIAMVQGKLAHRGIGKDNKNTQQNYKFRGIDDVYNALAPLLSEAGLCILPRVMHREVTEQMTAKGGKLFYVVLDVEFDFVSASDGSSHTVRMVGEAMDSGDKASNKAMSAAYKYACLQTFCIPTQGDNDADATTHEVAPYTQDQYEKFHKIVSDGDALAYVGYMEQLDVNTQTALYNSWEQGKKTEGKKKCDTLNSSGIDLIAQYVDALNEGAANQDDAKLEETLAEIGEDAKGSIWKRLAGETQQAIRQMKS